MSVQDSEVPEVDRGGRPISVVTEGLIDFVVERLAYSVRKFQIKREVSLILYGPADEKFPEIPVKTIAVETYEILLNKARAVLKQRAAVNAHEAREDSIIFYEAILADPDVHANTKIKARDNLNKIMGVVKPDHGMFVPGIMIPNAKTISIEDLNLTMDQKKELLAKERNANSDS